MPPKETSLTSAQIQEFNLNRLGYYCKVREDWQWNNDLRKKVRKGFLFDIIQYEDIKEVIIQKGTKLFSCGEKEAMVERDKEIESYLKKLKNN